MSLEFLTKLLPPPANPKSHGSDAQWSKFEQELGTSVPSDYREFIGSYGTGAINDFLWILNPFEENENINFIAASRYLMDAYSTLKEEYPEYYKHSVYPKRGGILPWGFTIDSDSVFWVTNDQANKWKVGVHDKMSYKFVTYDCNMSNFLSKIIDGQISCPIFPGDFPGDNPIYEMS